MGENMKEIIVIKAEENNFNVKVDVKDVETKNLLPLIGSLNNIIHRLNDMVIEEGEARQ
jgi:hypothetical protein